MPRDPRQLDQNPVVIDPANVDAVLDDRPTPVTDPFKPPLDEVHNDNDPERPKAGPKTRQTVDGSHDGTPDKPDDKRR